MKCRLVLNWRVDRGCAVSKIIVATRKSPLALWQANYVKRRLEEIHAGIEVSILGMTSKGDQLLDHPLYKVGGKGLFVKELETALLDGRADIAVHSMKDVPMSMPDDLTLGIICEREDPRDALVGANCFDDLPKGARLGTSSLRRSCQLRYHRPDLKISFLRGNVNTRLAKLDSGEFDSILLACAGLIRLGLSTRIGAAIDPQLCLPAAGQGAVGIEFRDSDEKVRNLLQPLQHDETARRILAERSVVRHLDGGCDVPIASYAELIDEKIWLRARVGGKEDSIMLQAEAYGYDPEKLGTEVAESLIAQGANDLLLSQRA